MPKTPNLRTGMTGSMSWDSPDVNIDSTNNAPSNKLTWLAGFFQEMHLQMVCFFIVMLDFCGVILVTIRFDSFTSYSFGNWVILATQFLRMFFLTKHGTLGKAIWTGKNLQQKEDLVEISVVFELHPWRLTWNIYNSLQVWKIIFLSKWVICRFQPLIFQGVCMSGVTEAAGRLKDSAFVHATTFCGIFHHYATGFFHAMWKIMPTTLWQINMAMENGSVEDAFPI